MARRFFRCDVSPTHPIVDESPHEFCLHVRSADDGCVYFPRHDDTALMLLAELEQK
jgi:hypothetical protein